MEQPRAPHRPIGPGGANCPHPGAPGMPHTGPAAAVAVGQQNRRMNAIKANHPKDAMITPRMGKPNKTSLHLKQIDY